MKRKSVLTIIFQLLFQDSFSQSIVLNNYDQLDAVTNCSLGLIANEKYFLTGQIDATGVDLYEWPLKFSFVTRLNSSGAISKLCDLNIAINGCNSTLKETFQCYCESNTSSIYNYIVRNTATTSLSGYEIQGQWTNKYFSDAKFTSYIKLPTVNDEAEESLQIESQQHELSGLSEILLVQNGMTSVNLTYCVSGLREGYSLEIKLNSTLLSTSKSFCASTLVVPEKLEHNQYLTLSYEELSGCGRKGSHTILISAKPPSSVDYTDTIIGVVVGVGSCLLIAGIVIAVLIYKKEKPKCSDSKIILVIVVTVAGSVVIVGIIIGLLFYCNVCKFKKANKQATSLTLAETTSPTNETSARHIETKKPLTPLAHLPPHKISPTISGNNERASNLTESNETPNDSPRKKKSKKKRARRKIENGGKNDEQ